ncbi:hypothetical protein OROGR_008819 [Orobanche gracilis]
MDRNRESRRASIVGSNGFNRRRHRTNSLRDSPDDDGGLELQESVRLRERVKKDRDRERERERDRERYREIDSRERSSRSKRRGERLMTSNRDDTGGDETSEESVNDDEDEEDDENTAAAARFSSPMVSSLSDIHHNISKHHHSQNSSFSNITSNLVSSNNRHLQLRKTSAAAAAKVLRAPPVWKPTDEMISVSVPRKARSASKRSHDWISSSSNNNSGGGDQNPAQPSSSPARQSHALTSTAAPAHPMSPSSSNISIRKKLKHSVNNTTVPKPTPPKVSSSPKPSSSNPEELEIEIAEVLYGLMTQSQGPSSSKKEESSTISNSHPNNNPILGPNSAPLSAVAPKRKRPRQIPEIHSGQVSAKPDADQIPKSGISSPDQTEKPAGNGCNSVISQGRPAGPPLPTAPESLFKSDLEINPVAEEIREIRDSAVKEDVSSSKKQESSAVRAQDNTSRDSPLTGTASSAVTPINANLMVSENLNQKDGKFEIDLMAPPKIDPRPPSVDQNPVLSILDADLRPRVVPENDEAENGKIGSWSNNSPNVAAEEKKREEAESNKAFENKDRNMDFCLNLENPKRDVSCVFNNNANENNKTKMQTQKQQQPRMPLKPSKEEPPTDKYGHSTSSLPLPMSMATWPGGLPPMGYIAPLQGVVSMEGGSATPAHMQPLFSQPRPKRCATHCHIARNIHCFQQFMKMNPFWPMPAGSPATIFGSKPCNLNAVPPADLNVAVRGVSSAQEKGQSVVSIPPNNGGMDKSCQPVTDSAQRKQQQPQILVQQALPPVVPSNLLGPTFIFPLNHQQQAAMTARPATAKPPTTTVASFNTTPTPVATTSSSIPSPMSFNYPNISPNETQYLAILQNNGYPFPIPTIGAPPPSYRAPPAQAMPLFNGSFYSSQIGHHQLQHSQQQPSNQPPQSVQGHQNAATSNNSSSSQKQHNQNQQQRQPQSSGNGSLQNNLSSQKAQQSCNQYNMHGSEDSQSTNDNRGARASMSIYGQNFALPIHPQNFAMMTTPAALATANSNQNGRKSPHPTQQQPQQGVKTGVDSLPPHTFAMSFGPISGTIAVSAGIDTSSMTQNHSTFQSCPESARQNIQMAVAAQAAQKNFCISEDGNKSGNVDSSREDERKNFAFMGSDMANFPITSSVQAHTSSIQANTVMESSARSLTIGSGPARTSRPATSNGVMGAGIMGVMNVPSAHVQAQLHQQQMLQLKQQKPQQMAANAAVNRNKPPVTSNGSIYSEHLNSSSVAGPGPKFTSTISPFPQNFQSNTSSPSPSPSQSPQWKSSARTPPSQVPSSLGLSNASMHKNFPQHHSRTQHTQISFGGNQRQQSANSPGQQAPPPSSNNQVGSPTTSSVSRGTSGSPRTTSTTSTNNKISNTSSFSAQPPKNGPYIPSQKSPSILGNPHGVKTQMQQQSPTKTMQQAQLFFSNPYSQSQSHSLSTSSAMVGPNGYYMPQRRSDPQQNAQAGTLCSPNSVSSTNTNDPATAIAAATCNVKGGGLQSQGVVHASPFGGQSTGMMLPAGFSYVHPVPAGVQVKPADQKQPAGNDSMHHPWQPEKK